MHQVLKGRPVWWLHHVGVFFTSLLFLIQICAVRGIELHALSENLFDQYLIESDAGRSKETSCISFLDSVSCEDLKGVGSLNNTCLLNSNLHLDDDLCLYGTGNLVVSQHVSIACPIKGCSVTINVSGSVQVGPYAQVVAGSIVFGATNFTLYHHSTIDTTSLGGPPPAQTSGTPTGNDGAGGGHGGRGASCLKSNRTNWGGDVYAWSTLSDPWSYGSKGGCRSAEKQCGGDGGGRIMVKVNDSLIVDGTISAEGGSGSLEGGGGSGGSIIVHALKLIEDNMSSSNSSQHSSSSQNYLSKLKAEIRMRPPPYPNPTCKCGFRLRMETSFTERNPCRRFANCGNKECRRFIWIDENEVPCYGKECLNLLLRRYGELGVEFERLTICDDQVLICDECIDVKLRCKELESQLYRKEKMIQVGILSGIVIGFLLAIFLVLISK